MSEPANIQTLLSASEVARMANLPRPRFEKLLSAGHIVPDFRNGKTLLFLPVTGERIKLENTKP